MVGKGEKCHNWARKGEFENIENWPKTPLPLKYDKKISTITFLPESPSF
jgi:hypothetical protein